MEIKGLDNRIYKWNPLNSKRVFSSVSSYHERARNLLKDMFKFDTILEEVDLPGTTTRINGVLRADFYIPKHKIIVEVHGEQHYEHSTFFHSSELDYKKAIARDKNKETWCNINNITLIILPYNESDEEWRNRIWQT